MISWSLSPRSILWRISSMITSRSRPLTNVLHVKSSKYGIAELLLGYGHTQISTLETSSHTPHSTRPTVPPGPRLPYSTGPVPFCSVHSSVLLLFWRVLCPNEDASPESSPGSVGRWVTEREPADGLARHQSEPDRTRRTARRGRGP